MKDKLIGIIHLIERASYVNGILLSMTVYTHSSICNVKSIFSFAQASVERCLGVHVLLTTINGPSCMGNAMQSDSCACTRIWKTLRKGSFIYLRLWDS